MRKPLEALILRRSWLGVMVAVLLCAAWVMAAAPAEAAEWLVRAGQEEKVKDLFGDRWSGPTGPFRVTRGRVYRSNVIVSLIAGDRRAALRIEHSETARSPEDDDVFEIVAADKGLRVTASCTPACPPAVVSPLRQLADRIVARYQGDLFVPAPGVTASLPAPGPPGPEGSSEHAAPAAAHGGHGIPGLSGWRASLALSALWPVLAAIALVRALCSRSRSTLQLARDMAVVFGGTIAAACILTEPGMSNWYLDFLPARGRAPPLGERLGAGAHVFETFFRALLPWTDGALYGLTLAVGAAGTAFTFAAFRALALPRATCFAAVALFALSPLGVRSLWSGSPHVLAFGLQALLLFAWLQAQDEGRWPEIALALVLVPTIGLVRGDAIVFAATPLVWGLARRNARRRLALAALYAVVLAASAWLTWELVVLRSGAPLPEPGERLGAARFLFAELGLFRQLFDPMAGPSWIPLPAAALAVAGAAVLAVRRPGLLAKLLLSLALPQIVLVRFVNDEGLVGARYFIVALPLLALLAAVPLGPPTAPGRLASSRAARPVALAAIAVAALATIVAGRRAYRERYTFQEEYRFLRTELSAAPRPSRVYHLAVHDDPAFRSDPDCCLSPGRSPLVLALPGIDFEPLDVDPGEARLPVSSETCAYYYESAMCSYGPTERTESHNPSVTGAVHEACRRLAEDPRLELVGSATLPARATWPVFAEPEVRVRLFRMGACAP